MIHSPKAVSPTATPHLPLARYRLTFRILASLDGAVTELGPNYLGSAWRGAFGHALKKMVCVTRLPVCDPCALLYSCPYPYLFEGRTPPGAKKLSRYPYTPGAYVLEPPVVRIDADSGVLRLGLVLFGAANEQLPYIVYAFERVGERGLTAKRVKLRLLEVQAESPALAADDAAVPANTWKTIYRPGDCLHPLQPAPPPLPTLSEALRVRLVSPLRIKRHETLLSQSDLSFGAFFGNLMRRISMLTYFFSDTPLETDFACLRQQAESVTIHNQAIRWHEWTRLSSRQGVKMQMGGLLGSFELDGQNLERFWPYLWLGQWTHIGKGCSMGLGHYRLEALTGDHADTAAVAGGGHPPPVRWRPPAAL